MFGSAVRVTRRIRSCIAVIVGGILFRCWTRPARRIRRLTM
nr:hypothetical protein [Kibdelosporangium sp. MJ126-NF4]